MCDEELAECLAALYRLHELYFEEENIKDILVCVPNIRSYMQDIGFQIGKELISISSINGDTKWIKCKLQMLKVYCD